MQHSMFAVTVVASVAAFAACIALQLTVGIPMEASLDAGTINLLVIFATAGFLVVRAILSSMIKDRIFPRITGHLSDDGWAAAKPHLDRWHDASFWTTPRSIHLAGLFALARVDASEHNAVYDMCVRIACDAEIAGGDPEDAADLMLAIVQLPAAQRAMVLERSHQFMAELRRGRLRRANLENVMSAERITATLNALAIIKDKVGLLDEAQTQVTLSAVEEHILAQQAEAVGPSLMRGGGTAEQNALRTLRDPIREGDYGQCLKENATYRLRDSDIALGSLCAQVWRGIEAHYAAQMQDPWLAPKAAATRESLRRDLLMQLAECIEDDGHRVCGVGMSERLAMVLSPAFYPHLVINKLSMQELACEFGAELTRTSDRVGITVQTLADVKKRAENEAVRLFKRNSAAYIEFTQLFQTTCLDNFPPGPPTGGATVPQA